MCWKQKPENCHSISAKDEIFFPKEIVWQSCRLFWWMFENGEKEIFFEKSTFHRNFLRTRRNCFDFSTEVEKNSLKVGIWFMKGVKLTTRIFSIRFFYGHVEGFFDNTWRRFAEFLGENQCFSKKLAFIKVFLWPFTLEIWQHCWNYFAKSRSIFAQCPKMIKTNDNLPFFFKQKLISSNCSYGRVEQNFEKPADLHLLINREWWKKRHFLRNIVFNNFSCGHVENCFHYHRRTYREKFERKSMIVSINQMNLVLSKKLLFFEVLFWLFSLEHWQHCRRFLPKADFFSVDVRKWRKNNWKQKSAFMKIILWTFRKPLLQNRREAPKLFVQGPKKNWKITKLFWKKNMSNCSYGHVESSSDKPANFISL